MSADPFVQHDPLIDPELSEALLAFPPFDKLDPVSLATMRVSVGDLARTQIEQTPLAGVRYFERDADGVRVLVYQPDPLPTTMAGYLHIHGGGLVLGTPEMRHIGSVNLVRSFGCTVISVDYRLAPEAPYPAASDDCFSALKWLTTQARDLHIDPTRIVIGGESAGGGLAAALAIRARDADNLPIRFQMLTYPMLDDRTCLAPGDGVGGKHVWTLQSNTFGWRSYLAADPGGLSVSAYAAAARCENLAGLPPAFIAVGSIDLFLEEDIDYACRLIRAGVPAELHVYPGAFHAFDLVVDATVTKAFKRDWNGAFVRAIR